MAYARNELRESGQKQIRWQFFGKWNDQLEIERSNVDFIWGNVEYILISLSTKAMYENGLPCCAKWKVFLVNFRKFPSIPYSFVVIFPHPKPRFRIPARDSAFSASIDKRSGSRDSGRSQNA